MFVAQKVYKATAVGAEGTMTYGGVSGDVAALEAFAAEFSELEDMQNQGLIEITYRHTESQTGKKYVDLVRFKRLA